MHHHEPPRRQFHKTEMVSLSTAGCPVPRTWPIRWFSKHVSQIGNQAQCIATFSNLPRAQETQPPLPDAPPCSLTPSPQCHSNNQREGFTLREPSVTTGMLEEASCVCVRSQIPSRDILLVSASNTKFLLLSPKSLLKCVGSQKWKGLSFYSL